jgi:hypothetical protein
MARRPRKEFVKFCKRIPDPAKPCKITSKLGTNTYIDAWKSHLSFKSSTTFRTARDRVRAQGYKIRLGWDEIRRRSIIEIYKGVTDEQQDDIA